MECRLGSVVDYCLKVERELWGLLFTESRSSTFQRVTKLTAKWCGAGWAAWSTTASRWGGNCGGCCSSNQGYLHFNELQHLLPNGVVQAGQRGQLLPQGGEGTVGAAVHRIKVIYIATSYKTYCQMVWCRLGSVVNYCLKVERELWGLLGSPWEGPNPGAYRAQWGLLVRKVSIQVCRCSPLGSLHGAQKQSGNRMKQKHRRAAGTRWCACVLLVTDLPTPLCRCSSAAALSNAAQGCSGLRMCLCLDV